jgi:flavin reductase (DIM6/NTAB) family NADH-FMN oxidoreductase RutF
VKPLAIDGAFNIMPTGLALIGSSWQGKDNVMTAAWVVSCSVKPPLVSVFIHHKWFTRELVSKSKEFVVNVLASDQAEISEICGTVSGRKVDKYARANLKTRRGEKVNVPLIEGCLANLECRVVADYEVGDHTLFVGEIVAAHDGGRRDPLVYFERKYADIVLKPQDQPGS